jgi:7-cyano-7-deazaguanine synthase in queuosine biosynthesis
VVEAERDRGLRPVLVSHTTDYAKSARQVGLVRELRRRVPEWEFPHIVVWVHRKGSEPRDTTQRARAFLFAAIGTAIAAELHIGTVLLADNGVVSLNLPVNDQALGTRATRSTHPKFISLFNTLAGHAFTQAPRVLNPLWSRTRGEVLRLLKDHGLTSLLRLTNSCAHPTRRPREQPHCGVCSQCVDRRFATVGEGLESDDPATGYGTDIFRDPLDAGPARLYALSYYTWALRVTRTPDDAMFIEFPQLADAILSDDPTPTDTYIQLTGMLRRQAENSLRVLKEQVVSAGEELVSHDLPDTCLLRLAVGPDPSGWYVDRHGVPIGAGAEPGAAAPQPMASEQAGEAFKHSEDYRSVTLRGRTYSLNGTQAAAVRMLHEAYLNGTPELGQHTILERLGVLSTRLRSVFHRLDGWEELIVAGKTKGSFRLNL